MPLLFKVIPVHHMELNADVAKYKRLLVTHHYTSLQTFSYTLTMVLEPDMLQCKKHDGSGKIIFVCTLHLWSRINEVQFRKLNCFQYPIMCVKLNLLKYFYTVKKYLTSRPKNLRIIGILFAVMLVNPETSGAVHCFVLVCQLWPGNEQLLQFDVTWNWNIYVNNTKNILILWY